MSGDRVAGEDTIHLHARKKHGSMSKQVCQLMPLHCIGQVDSTTGQVDGTTGVDSTSAKLALRGSCNLHLGASWKERSRSRGRSRSRRHPEKDRLDDDRDRRRRHSEPHEPRRRTRSRRGREGSEGRGVHRHGGSSSHWEGGGGADGITCPICWAWVRNKTQLQQHQETSARCQSYQGKGPAKITCEQCGKKITAQRWAVEQHSWTCRARGDVSKVLGRNQHVEDRPEPAKPGGVRLQSVMVVRDSAWRKSQPPPEPKVPPKHPGTKSGKDGT